MPIVDGSTSTYPYTRAVYGALFWNYDNHPQFPESHSKSHESYERLINGEVDALFAATLPSEEPCPIVLDDALVNLDSARRAAAMEVLGEIAETRQVILFTCN